MNAQTLATLDPRERRRLKLGLVDVDEFGGDLDKAATVTPTGVGLVVSAGSTAWIGANRTISRPLIVKPGGTINVNGYILTLSSFAARRHVAFSLDGGSVAFSVGSVPYVLPQWWAEVGTGSNDDVAFQAAVNAAKEIGVNVRPGAGIFTLDATLEFTEGTATASMLTRPVAGLVGDGPDVTVFKAGTSITASDYLIYVYHPTLGGPTSTKASGGVFRDFSVDGNFRAEEHHGIAFDGSHFHVNRIHVRNVDGTGVRFGLDKVAREIMGGDIHIRSCGRHTGAGGSTNAPAYHVGIPSDDDTECNNIYLDNLQIVYPWYSGMFHEASDTHPSRDFYYDRVMLHGWESGGTQQGRLHSDSAMFDLAGPVQNVVIAKVFLTRVGSDDAATGLGTHCVGFRIRKNGETNGPDNITIRDVTAETSSRGYLVKLDGGGGRRIWLEGVQIASSSSDYPSGHLVADEASFTALYVSNANFAATRVDTFFSDGAKIDDDLVYIMCKVTADSAASSTFSDLQVAGFPRRMYVHKVEYSPSAAVTAHATNYARIRAYRKPAGSAEQMAEVLTNSSSMSAYTKYALTLTDGAATQIDTDHFLGVQTSKANAGVQLPAGIVMFTLGSYVKSADS